MHSDRSDGEHSPDGVLRRCKKYGVEDVFLTDHDTVSGIPQAIVSARKYGIRFSPGIEITATEGGLEMHVLGLGIDHQDRVISDYSARISDAYKKRAVKIVGKIKNDPEHSWEVDSAVLHKANGVITRIDISRAIKNSGMPFAEFFMNYLDVGKKYYVGIEKVSVREAIEIIHSAGGKAIWAHSEFSLRDQGDKYSMAKLAKKFALQGLDGLETYYKKYTEEETLNVSKAAEELGLLRTPGSDFHRDSESLPGQFNTYGLKFCPKEITGRLSE